MEHSLKGSMMKQRLVLAGLLLVNGAAFAVNPVDGWYAGLVLGVSYAHRYNFNYTFVSPLTLTTTTAPIEISHGVLGNIAGQAGYRFNHFRIEGELLINYNPYSVVKVGSYNFHKTGAFNPGYGMKGQTTTGAILANGFYDFYSLNDGANFSPYVGLGIGYAYVQNNVSFYFNNQPINQTDLSATSRAPAAQIIIGINRFVDDFTTVGLDFRRLASNRIQPFDSRIQISSVNITINGSFDRG